VIMTNCDTIYEIMKIYNERYNEEYDRDWWWRGEALTLPVDEMIWWWWPYSYTSTILLPPVILSMLCDKTMPVIMPMTLKHWPNPEKPWWQKPWRDMPMYYSVKCNYSEMKAMKAMIWWNHDNWWANEERILYYMTVWYNWRVTKYMKIKWREEESNIE